MIQSHVIEVDGAFLGAAVRQERGYRFIAVDLRMEELDGSVWPTLADTQRLARSLLTTGRLPQGPAQ
jgi:hypothetical protein